MILVALPKYWGSGYATEITAALVKYLFEDLKLDRIEAMVAEGNPSSRKVLEKAGFIVIVMFIIMELSGEITFAIVEEPASSRLLFCLLN